MRQARSLWQSIVISNGVAFFMIKLAVIGLGKMGLSHLAIAYVP